MGEAVYLRGNGPAQAGLSLGWPLRFQTIGERFLGRTLNNVHVVKW